MRGQAAERGGAYASIHPRGEHEVGGDTGQKDDDEDGYAHAGPIGTISSNKSTGSRMPAATSFSLNLGRMPVAANRPRTFPPGETPRFSKTKISCKVTMSVSIPVTSVTLVTRR